MPSKQCVALVLTCEHAGNRVPREFRRLFQGQAGLLASHRGWDPGALAIALALARAFDTSVTFSLVTRLLVEVNRSERHPRLFSSLSRSLDPPTRARLLMEYYHPHRHEVRDRIKRLCRQRVQVLHIGVHTFTPVLDGIVRNADIGLLYDPRRRGEREWCHAWSRALRAADPALRVRANYPYRGISDGLTTSMRREFSGSTYVGIELEVNQALAASPDRAVRGGITRTIVESLGQLMNDQSDRVQHPAKNTPRKSKKS